MPNAENDSDEICLDELVEPGKSSSVKTQKNLLLTITKAKLEKALDEYKKEIGEEDAQKVRQSFDKGDYVETAFVLRVIYAFVPSESRSRKISLNDLSEEIVYVQGLLKRNSEF